MSSEGRIGEIWKEMGNCIYLNKMLKAKRLGYLKYRILNYNNDLIC